MQIVVTELPIEDAVSRARERFQKADRRLARALEGGALGIPWLVAGALAIGAGVLGLMELAPASVELTVALGLLLSIGGALIGYGLPLWSNARRQRKRCSNEWRHALQMVRLREQQAEENPALTVEVLDRVDGQHQVLAAKWNARNALASRYVQ